MRLTIICLRLQEDNTRTDLTPTSGDEFTTGGIPRNPFGNYLIRDGDWQTALFTGGYNFIINNGFNTPAYFNQDMTRFEALPGWNYVSDRWISAKVVRGVGNRLIAGNLTHRLRSDLTMSQNFPGTIRLSTLAAAGDVPDTWEPLLTNTADEFELSNTSAVQDIIPLQGQAIVYTTDSIHSINIQGADAQVRTVAEGYGALTTGAVIEFDGRHLVVGSDDIYIFGGHPGSIQSVADSKIREFFFNDLNPLPEVQGNLFILRDKAIDEIQIFYPTGSSLGEADRYLAWNYRNNTWSINDAPDLVSGAVGPIRGGGVAEITSVLTGTGNEEENATREQQTITISDVTLDGPIREQQMTRFRRRVGDTGAARASTFTEEVFTLAINDDIIPTNDREDIYRFTGNSGTPNRDIGTQTGTAALGANNNIGTTDIDLTVTSNFVAASMANAAPLNNQGGSAGTFIQTGDDGTTARTVVIGTDTVAQAIGTNTFTFGASGTNVNVVVTNPNLLTQSVTIRINFGVGRGGAGTIEAAPQGPFNSPIVGRPQINGANTATASQGATGTLSVTFEATTEFEITSETAGTDWSNNAVTGFDADTGRFNFPAQTKNIPASGGTTYTLSDIPAGADIDFVLAGTEPIADRTLTEAVGDNTVTFSDNNTTRDWTLTGTVPVAAETGTLNADGTFATGTTTGISGFTGLDLTVANGAFGGIPMTGDTFSLPGSTVAATYTRTQGSQSYEHDFNTNQFRRSGTALGTPRIPTQAEFDAAVRSTGVFDRNLLPNGIYVEFQDQVGSTADDSNRIYQVLNGVTTNLFLAGTNIPASASVGTNNQGVLTLGADATSVNLAGLRYTLTNNTSPFVSFPEVNLTVDGNTSATTALTTSGSTAVVDVGGVSAGDTWSVSLGEADEFRYQDPERTVDRTIRFPGGQNSEGLARFFADQVNGIANGVTAVYAGQDGAAGLVRINYRGTNTGGHFVQALRETGTTNISQNAAGRVRAIGDTYAVYNWSVIDADGMTVETSGTYSPGTAGDQADVGKTAATIVQELGQDIVNGNTGWTLSAVTPSDPAGHQVIHINTNDSENRSLVINAADSDRVLPGTEAGNGAINFELSADPLGVPIEGDGRTPTVVTATAAPNAGGTTPTSHMITALSGEGLHALATRVAAAITSDAETPSNWTADVEPGADTLTVTSFTFLADGDTFTPYTGGALDFTGFNPSDTGTAESVTPLFFDGTDTYIWVRPANNNLHISQQTATAETWAFASDPVVGTDPLAVNTWTEVTGNAPGTQVVRANAVVEGITAVDILKTADAGGIHPGLWTFAYATGMESDMTEVPSNLEFGDTSVTREGTNHSVRIDVTSPEDGTTVDMIFSDGTDEQGVATDLATGLAALPYIRTAVVDSTNDAQVNITYEAEDYVVNAARGLVLNPATGVRDVPADMKIPTFAVAFPFTADAADATTDNSANIMADDFTAAAVGPNQADTALLVRGHPEIDATVISVTIGTRTESITTENNATTQQLTTNLFNLITSQFSREVTASLIDPTTINIVTRDFGDSLLDLRIFFDNVTRQDTPESFIRSDAPTVTPDRISDRNDLIRPWRTNQFNLGREFVITAAQNGQSFGHGFGFTKGAAPVNTVGNTDPIVGDTYESYVERIHNPLDGEVEYTKAAEYAQLLLSDGDVDIVLGMTDSPGDLRNLYIQEDGTAVTPRTFFRENDYKVDFRRHGRLFNIRISDPTNIVDATTDQARARTTEDPATGWRVAGYGLSAGREEQRGGRR